MIMPPKTHIIYFQNSTSEFTLIKNKLHLIPHLHSVSFIEEERTQLLNSTTSFHMQFKT